MDTPHHLPELFQGSASYPVPSPQPIVTIGNFDGVHLGHCRLIEPVLERARKEGRPSCVYTFHPAPRDVLRPGNSVVRIQRQHERLLCLGALGVDQVVIEPFTLEFSKHDAQWFAQEILARRLGASSVYVGWDFRFGRNREGGRLQLDRWMTVDVIEVGPFQLQEQVVSSSRIRKEVHRGHVDLAAALLGRPHRVVGEVVKGDGRGRTLGFPTANLVPQTPLVPVAGVYAVFVAWGSQAPRMAVVNIGNRPTFADAEASFEVHVLDFQGDLYGTSLHVDFVKRLRDEQSYYFYRSALASNRCAFEPRRGVVPSLWEETLQFSRWYVVCR